MLVYGQNYFYTLMDYLYKWRNNQLIGCHTPNFVLSYVLVNNHGQLETSLYNLPL